MMIDRTDGEVRTGYEVANLSCQTVGEKQKLLHRDVFAERYQMNFIVSRNHLAFRVQHGGTVRRSVGDLIDIADKDICIRLPGDLLDTLMEFRIFFEVKRRRGFRPHDE